MLRLLISLGCDFDVASLGEVELCLELGAHPGQLSYGNTVKKSGDIAQAYALGVRTFAADCEAELDKLVEHAPGSLVLLRMATDGHGADWPLSRKFGCGPGQVEALARQAAAHGMRVGVGFHVGSQQHDVHAWDAPIAIAADLGVRLAESGIRLEALNLGGGLPSSHAAATAPVEAYGRAITDALRRHTDGGLRGVRIMAEPGRYLVGDAGVLRTEVVLVSERDSDARRWVFLDVGMFNGLAETAEEAIRYRIRCPRPHADPVPAVLAGPTCDSLDVLYERAPYPLPADLRAGDRLDVLSAGAYTTTYSSVWFNGFEPLRAYHLAASTPARAPVPAATRG